MLGSIKAHNPSEALRKNLHIMGTISAQVCHAFKINIQGYNKAQTTWHNLHDWLEIASRLALASFSPAATHGAF